MWAYSVIFRTRFRGHSGTITTSNDSLPLHIAQPYDNVTQKVVVFPRSSLYFISYCDLFYFCLSQEVSRTSLRHTQFRSAFSDQW